MTSDERERPGAKGNRAETAALNWLCARKHRLIERNFRCKQGEIDLILEHQDAEDHKTLVFVEVRYRKRNDYGTATESVSQYKIKRIIHTAEFFLLKYPQFSHWSYRFDVIGLSGEDGIEWIQGAFDLNS
ncbi:MAG: YraN family protein [Gammaproteobacteria bacterium]|nr:YraN family protein [Gammaproteobacteria bacterium]